METIAYDTLIPLSILQTTYASLAISRKKPGWIRVAYNIPQRITLVASNIGVTSHGKKIFRVVTDVVVIGPTILLHPPLVESIIHPTPYEPSQWVACDDLPREYYTAFSTYCDTTVHLCVKEESDDLPYAVQEAILLGWTGRCLVILLATSGSLEKINRIATTVAVVLQHYSIKLHSVYAFTPSTIEVGNNPLWKTLKCYD